MRLSHRKLLSIRINFKDNSALDSLYIIKMPLLRRATFGEFRMVSLFLLSVLIDRGRSGF